MKGGIVFSSKNKTMNPRSKILNSGWIVFFFIFACVFVCVSKLSRFTGFEASGFIDE